jgi:hypothetical protein
MLRIMMGVSLCLTVLASAGCGSADQKSPRVQVSGVVTLDGAPLESGQISFVPKDGKLQPTGAEIGAGGKFSAAVAPGEMQVEIRSPKVTGTRKAYDTPDSPLIDVTKEQIPSRYNTKSELVIDVIAGQNDDKLKFELTTSGNK